MIKEFFCILALLFTFAFSSGSAVYAQTTGTNVSLPVMQKFTEEYPQNHSVNKTGHYELIPLEKDYPMPDKSTDGRYSFTLEGDGHLDIPITCYHSGLYQYQLKQTTADAQDYIIDNTIYTICVYLKNGEDGQMVTQIIAENEQHEKCENLLFENVYTKKPAMTGSAPTTGDTSHASPWIFMLIISFTGGIGILLLQKKSAVKE